MATKVLGAFRALGWDAVEVIDDDLGRSGWGEQR
jgi:hypothetical protein